MTDDHLSTLDMLKHEHRNALETLKSESEEAQQKAQVEKNGLESVITQLKDKSAKALESEKKQLLVDACKRQEEYLRELERVKQAAQETDRRWEQELSRIRNVLGERQGSLGQRVQMVVEEMGDGELVDLIGKVALFVQEVQREEDKADRELEVTTVQAEATRLDNELKRHLAELEATKGSLSTADETLQQLRL